MLPVLSTATPSVLTTAPRVQGFNPSCAQVLPRVTASGRNERCADLGLLGSLGPGHAARSSRIFEEFPVLGEGQPLLSAPPSILALIFGILVVIDNAKLRSVCR